MGPLHAYYNIAHFAHQNYMWPARHSKAPPHEVLGAHLLWGFFFFEAHLLGEEKKEFTVRCYLGPTKKSVPHCQPNELG